MRHQLKRHDHVALNSRGARAIRLPVSGDRKGEIDEQRIAELLVLGYSQNQIAQTARVTPPVIARRVKQFRKVVSKTAPSAELALWWRDQAPPAWVARRWLWLELRDQRYAPFACEGELEGS